MRSLRLGTLVPVMCAMSMLVIGAAVFGAQPSQPAAQGDDNGNMQSNANDAYQGYSDYPGAEVRAVPVARANAVRARLEQELIQTNLHRWIDRSWDDFMHSKDYLDVSTAESKALTELARERERVLKRLQDDTNYRALSDLVADLRDKLDRERPRSLSNANQDALDNLMALATLKLGYSSALSGMESAALAADDAVQSARTRLRDAAAKARDMRRGFDRSVRRDPTFLAERARYDEARINRVVSATFLDSAINARDIALDYAYYVHQWDQYKYSTAPVYGYPYYTGASIYTTGYTRRY